MKHPRSQEDFDRWFRQSGGDPWGYENEYIKERLRASLAFIRSKVGGDYRGTFLEFGAFDGSFTRLLATAFPDAHIVANDISGIAVEKMKAALAGNPRVEIVESDMVAMTSREAVPSEHGIVVLLLECLYYLPADEQLHFLSRLREQYPRMTLFLSAPMQGDQYYDEKKLDRLLREAGLSIRSRRILTFSKVPPLHRITGRLMNFSSYFRNRYASQVIHLVMPINS